MTTSESARSVADLAQPLFRGGVDSDALSAGPLDTDVVTVGTLGELSMVRFLLLVAWTPTGLLSTSSTERSSSRPAGRRPC